MFQGAHSVQSTWKRESNPPRVRSSHHGSRTCLSGPISIVVKFKLKFKFKIKFKFKFKFIWISSKFESRVGPAIFILLVLFQILPKFELKFKFNLKFKLKLEFKFKFLWIYSTYCPNSNSSLSLNSFFLNLFQILPEFKLKFKFKLKFPWIYSKFESRWVPLFYHIDFIPNLAQIQTQTQIQF
jgi:hypothetical protein